MQLLYNLQLQIDFKVSYHPQISRMRFSLASHPRKVDVINGDCAKLAEKLYENDFSSGVHLNVIE